MASELSPLRAMFDQPPEEAIAFLEAKGLRVTFDHQEMMDEAHARAFTVAKAMRLDVLRDIRTGLLDALKEGKTLRDFERDLVPLLQAKGWWGKQVTVDGDGQAQEVRLGSPHRLKTIYQTNLQSAYMAGRAKAQYEADAFPFLMYVALQDGRTRPSHAALHGRVWAKSDPIWRSITPPNGYNCRCRTRALTAGQMQREGLKVSEPPEIETRTVEAGVNRFTGETYEAEQMGVKVLDAKGKTRSMWVDPGFNSSPLAGHPFDELLSRKASEALGDEKGFSQVRDVILSETRLKAWKAFVSNTFDSGIRNSAGRPTSQGQTMTVGVLPPEAVRAAAEAAQAPVSPVLYVPDNLLAGRKAERHLMAGNALSREDWRDLPENLRDAAVYRDGRTGNVVLVWPGDEGTAFKAAFDRSGKMDTAFRVSHESIEADVTSGNWRLL